MTKIVWLGAIGLLSVLPACGGGGQASPDLAGVGAESTSGEVHLSAAEVDSIVNQARSQAEALGLPVTIAVLDHEGLVLAVFQMNGANPNITIRGGGTGGLDGVTLPAAVGAAISKGGTGAFFGTQGNAFTTRTAGFIIQEHFPPPVNPSPGGPLFGVQFSSLPCSDVPRPGHFDPAGADPRMKNLPLGLSADPGGLPLYKNGTAVGGIGVEGDGLYTVVRGLEPTAPTTEELIAAAGTRGFSAPPGIQGTSILVDGVRLPFANADPPGPLPPPAGGGGYIAGFDPINSPPVSAFKPFSVGGIPGSTDRTGIYDPGTVDSSDGGLTKGDVFQIVLQAATQAQATRAAIRIPLGSQARVSIAVVDTNGKILGLFRTTDAPIFGYDVSVQKARTVNFFSQSLAANELNAAGQGAFVTAANNAGVPLNGTIAYSDTAVGFLAQPIYPPGAFAGFELFTNGPFSLPLGQWSVFNTGLQLNLINLANLLSQTTPCTNIARIPNGIQIFSGSFPLYKNGVLVGGVGISGDGIDQDNIIAFMGSGGYQAPINIRSDQLVVLGARLPYSVFPRHPNL
jgi:uncharacterized protein GlcG (DUF336 family)